MPMVRAQQKGFEIPTDMQASAMNYLRDIESHYPGWYSRETRWTLSAYALYVRNLSGDRRRRQGVGLDREAG